MKSFELCKYHCKGMVIESITNTAHYELERADRGTGELSFCSIMNAGIA